MAKKNKKTTQTSGGIKINNTHICPMCNEHIIIEYSYPGGNIKLLSCNHIVNKKDLKKL